MVKVAPVPVNGKPVSERYGAPALEKGLDLIEILAEEAGAFTQKELAERAGKSVSEIFRMLGVLERRGYLVRDKLTGRYSLTLKLFVLGNRHQPTRRLQASPASTRCRPTRSSRTPSVACSTIASHSARSRPSTATSR